MTENNSRETVKYYTRARKFPILLGRMPDGTKIPGGPYTLHQFLAGLAVLAVGGLTMDIWGAFGRLGNLVVLLSLSLTALFLVGRIPLHGRSPFLLVTGLMRITSAPRMGRYRGRPIRIRRQHRITHKTNLYIGPLPLADQSGVSDVVVATAKPGLPGIPRLAVSAALSASRAPASPLSVRRALSPARAPLSNVQAMLARADVDNENKAVQ
jgi:hypothetical protein